MGRYVFAVAEQGLWSVLNLGVNLGLARFVSPEHYGAFVFWANLGFVLASLQSAVTLCHLLVLAPGGAMSPHRLETERLMHAVTLVFLLLVGVCALVGGHLWGGSAFDQPAAALFLPAYLLQQYLRAIYFSRGHPVVALVQTGMVLVLAALFLGVAIAVRPSLDANFVLLCLGAAYALVGVAGFIVSCGAQMRGRPRIDLRDYSAYVIQSGWIFLGVSTTELLARFYTFIVAAWYGPGPLAILAATQVLLRPVPLLASSLSAVARADLARDRESANWGRFKRVVLIALGCGILAAAAWAGLVAVSWSRIADLLFGGKYREFTWMVGLWGVSAALNFGQVVLNTGLQVLRAFKILALANAVASLTAAAAIMLIMWKFGYAGAIAGTAAGQLLEVVVMGWLLAASLRKLTAPVP